MKLIVLSDTHDARGMLELAAQHIEENGYDRIIHLGDIRGDARWLEDRLGREVVGVAGNCDFYSRDVRELVRNFDGVKILMTHGDAYGVKRSYDRLSYRAEEMGCAAAFFGHTHQAFVGRVGGVLLVNPGTLLNGRCAQVTIEAGKIEPRIIRI
jgi:putative phosphoesterase